MATSHDGLLCCGACGQGEEGVHDLDCLKIECSLPPEQQTVKKEPQHLLIEEKPREEREAPLLSQLLVLPELPARVYSEEEQLNQVLPLRLVKQREREEQKEVDKPCKFHVHGFPCYEELKWGYCAYVHSEEVRRALAKAHDQQISAQ